MDIAGKKITVIGGKRSGVALARLIIRLNGIARVSEQGGQENFTGEFRKWVRQHDVALEYGGHTQDFMGDSDLIVLSPGVRFDAPVVQWAEHKDIPILGEIEFAAQFCPKPMIAVTGSNGKTTVSTLIASMLQKAGYRTCLCGNVGFPFSDFVLHLNEMDFVVLEISSFQMESLLDAASKFKKPVANGRWQVKGFKPRIAVILNFSENHLDRHKDLNEYLCAKKKIFSNQDEHDFLVLNYADPYLKGLSTQARSRTVYFNMSGDDVITKNPNLQAVLAVGKILGIHENLCQEVFASFQGVEHRLEKVRTLSGVDFVNDSKATTAQAALWALNSIDRPIVMICGGRDKNIDFSVLAKRVQEKVKKMYVIGEARGKICKAFGHLISLEVCEGLQEAVVKAREYASPGDSVLLSPMCASFDMFKDFEERGRVFKEIVNRLK